VGLKLVVTKGGTRFDLPVLWTNFPDWQLPPLHIDLCPLLRKLGYKGGLKGVERQLGISRSPERDGLNGWDAVRSNRTIVGLKHERALKLLLRYNREDVEHLRPLLSFAYERLWQMSVTSAALLSFSESL